MSLVLQALLGDLDVQCIGVDAVVEGGRLTGATVRPLPLGDGAVALAREFLEDRDICARDSLCVAASSSQAALLRYAGYKACVNPSKKLAVIARTEDWPIYRDV